MRFLIINFLIACALVENMNRLHSRSFKLVCLAPPTSWYPSSTALRPLLIGQFPIIRHIQTSAVVRTVIDLLLSLYTSGHCLYVWILSFVRLVINTSQCNLFKKGTLLQNGRN